MASPSSGATQQPQPFEEQTTTMIVFPQGGVLKMAMSVSAGQVMVLTNLKSRQDAICRVLKVRAFAKGQSYVEVEFTNPQPGYWGVYFPSDGPEVARLAQQQPAAAPEVTPSTPAPPAPVESAPRVSVPAPVEQKPPEVSRTPVPVVAPPPANAPQPAVRAEVPQPAVVPPRPPLPPKTSEYSFVALGAKDEVLAPADSPRASRMNSFSSGTVKPQATADSDISDAIDAIIAPSSRAASSAPAPTPNRPASDWSLEGLPGSSDASASSSFKLSNSSSGNAEAGLPMPRQMFGVTLDSASGRSSRSGGTKWIPLGIAALLVVGAAGAYYFHFRSSSSEAAFTPAAATASATAAQPVSQPSASQPAQAAAPGNDGIQPDSTESASLSSAAGSPSNSAASDSTAPSEVIPPKGSAESRNFDPYAPRHASVAESKPLAQPNVAIPSTAGVLKARPVIRSRAHSGSIGAAPALDMNSGPVAPSASFAAIAPPPPKLEAPPKPVSTAPIRVGGKIQPPRLVSSVLPVYPPIAQQANVTGMVVIDTTIDKYGNVAKMRVISGPMLLRSAALGALRQWKYEPSKLNGEAISVEMIVSIQFH